MWTYGCQSFLSGCIFCFSTIVVDLIVLDFDLFLQVGDKSFFQMIVEPSVSYLAYASVSSKHQHPPGLTPGEFFKVVKFPSSGQKIFAKLRPRGKNRQKPAPGDNFVDLQDNFAMIVKPFAFFWYSSLAWLSSSFFKDYKACEYKISQ